MQRAPSTPLFDASHKQGCPREEDARPQVRAQAQIAMSERLVHHNGTSRCLWDFLPSELRQADGALPMTYPLQHAFLAER